MADQRESEVLGALPRTRPHRRSAKRPERPGEPKSTTKPAPRQAAPGVKQSGTTTPAPAGRPPVKPRAAGSRSAPRPVSGSRSATTRTRAKPDRLRQPPQPRGIPSQPRSPVPSTPQSPEILGTFVKAAAELTEIGLALGAQVLRRAVARLPRP